MAHYATTIHTPRTPAEAFAYVANLAHLPEWDPGVQQAAQVSGDGPGENAAYAVTLSPRPIEITYETTEYHPELLTTTLVATHSWFRSIDTVSAQPAPDGGAELTYDATLELRGPLAIADTIMRRAFNKIGDRAQAGLLRVLEGEKVA